MYARCHRHVLRPHLIDWHRIIAFRNLIVHDYGSFVPEILWDAIQTNVPELRNYCATQINAE
ncbi:DUF86 domain-containing protein [Candidatus Saccharibacteria bacterium]|nr:DUF86 domain-containing protein [Candidatus Saccharibacteria bacterium]